MIYVVITEDRHTDVEVELFADKTVAVDHAMAIAYDMAIDQDVEEQAIPDFLYFATYSLEGDSVSVVEREVITQAILDAEED